MPITSEQLRNYRWSVLDAVTSNTIEHTSQSMPSRLLSVDGCTVDLREVVTANAAARATSTVASRCDASNLDENFSRTPTFPRIRNNSAYAMDIDSMRRILESMAPNAVFGDLAALHERQFRPRSTTSHATCSNQVSDSAASNSAVSTDADMTQEDRIRAIAAFWGTDVDYEREILADTIRMRNAGPGRQFRPRPRPYDVLSKLEEDYRKWELEYIKKLLSGKALIRYRIEVK